MSERINEERLNDFVDGVLSEAETLEVEGLLRRSPEARQTVEFLRELKARSAELPDSIPPSRDLWPEIRSRLAAAPLAAVEVGAPRRAADADERTRELWPALSNLQWATLAAAAMLLVVSSSALTAWMVTAPGSGDAVVTGGPDASPAAATWEEPRPAEVEYAIEIEQLLWALYENRDTLDPDTISTIETNLRVIDRAIRRAREALDDEPENPGLARMLTNNYRHKLELLQRANRIIELS